MHKPFFYKITLPLEKHLFDELFDSVTFEAVTKGRIGNHLVRVQNDEVPIVRTSTIYNIPAFDFSSVHHRIIENLNTAIEKITEESLPIMDFNNALIEVYDCNYATMKYHSDQDLDLEKGSYIGLFTCYENPEGLTEKNIRKLKVKNKENGEEFEVPLTHNSIVLFDLETNSKYLHKIILESQPSLKKMEKDNRWMGLTFRKSKTFIHFKDNLPYFADGTLLTLADEDQKKEFYQLRGSENNNLNFNYPKLTYTLSEADTFIPKKND